MAKDGNRAISCYLSATEVAYIREYCEPTGMALYGFVKEAVREHIARTSEARDMRQGLDNLVEDPNCDYYLGTRNDSGQVQIVNKHTQIGVWFDNDAQAADHILGEESQARPPVVDDTNPTDEEVESYNTWVLVQIAEVQSQHRLTDEQNEALAYARQFIGGDD